MWIETVTMLGAVGAGLYARQCYLSLHRIEKALAESPVLPSDMQTLVNQVSNIEEHLLRIAYPVISD